MYSKVMNATPLFLFFFTLSIIVASLVDSDYITVSCNKTLYPDLCFKSLSKYATSIKADPKLLANTSLSLAFNTTRWSLSELRKIGGGASCVDECVEVVGDSVYNLQRSLQRLKGDEKGYAFVAQMNDVQTWVSAALTDEDTCMDDYSGGPEMRAVVRGLVLKVARLASIALAFINHYAAA